MADAIAMADFALGVGGVERKGVMMEVVSGNELLFWDAADRMVAAVRNGPVVSILV